MSRVTITVELPAGVIKVERLIDYEGLVAGEPLAPVLVTLDEAVRAMTDALFTAGRPA